MTRNKYLVEVLRITENKHTYTVKQTDELFIEIKDKLDDDTEISIKVEPKDLYEIPYSFIPRVIAWIKTGQRKHYLMVVNNQGKPITETAPAISGKVLRVARDWKGLDTAISDNFGNDLPIKRIAMIGAIIISVGIIAFLIYSGYIPTPESWGI